jgi:hypothetical protein
MHLLSDPKQWGALGLTVVTSTIIFFRRILVLDKYKCPLRRVHFAAYGVSLVSGLLFWASLNAITSSISEQFLFGITSTTLAWLVYVLMVNERLMYPSRQQWVSLLFHIITEGSLLFQVRLVLGDSLVR